MPDLAPTLEAARRMPGHPALGYQGQFWSYRELEALVQGFARRLMALKVRKGTRVGLWATNSPEWVGLAHAIPRLGAILMPFNTRLTDHELKALAAHVDLLIASPELARRARSLMPPDRGVYALGSPKAPEPDLPSATETPSEIPELAAVEPSPGPVPETLDPDAPHTILFTSGTSGAPKGVVLTWRNQVASAEASASILPLTPTDRWLDCLPLFHVGGLNILYRCALTGAAVILHDRFDPDAVNHSFDHEGATIASLVATTLSRTLNARTTPLPASVRAVLVGGGPVPPDLVARCPQALPTYGMTETCSGVTLVAPGAPDADRATAGRPMKGVDLEIRDEHGNRLPPETPGLIVVRGPMVTRGYLDDEATKRSIQEGWLMTSDFGLMDAEGRLTVLSRRTDLIVSGGENIYPAEVEAALRAHPNVQDAAVVGAPHPRWGQSPLAFVVAKTALADAEPGRLRGEEELHGFLAERLARYKLPSGYHFVTELPLLSNGKIDRLALKRLAELPIEAPPEAPSPS